MLTLESLLFKNIIINIISICECVIDDIIYQRMLWHKTKMFVLENKKKGIILSPFYSQIEILAEQGIMNKALYDAIDTIRKERNNLHLSSVSHREYDHYDIELANRAIKVLNLLQKLGPEMAGK